MTPDRAALVEKVARRMGEAISLWLHENPGCVLEDVDTAYIATAAIDLIRADVLDEAAVVFSRYKDDPFAASTVADHLRAMKGKP